ncbi:protein cueball isoform X1 [Nymphalis io]|uniref:protein cueball isoform X1 n=1 Tax=Inachis io TaxID=171585 RepID=UPI002169F8C8|nr:protein cueball isoform X1 [Nymphalis io]
MCRTQCLFAILAITINLVNSWDIAITTGDQLEFYTNQTKTSNEGIRFRDLTALAYDAVHNMLLFVDKQNDNASIFSYNLLTRKYQPLVGRRSYENIQGLAFDPVTAKMFWTDTNERSIYWISLWPRPKNNIYGNLLIKMDDEIPRDIAVDSCRGYIYWTNTNITKPTIERARFDGSERKIIVDTNIHMPVSIAIDQRTKRLYWADDKEGIHYSIESSDLEGKDRKTRLVGTYHQPNALTVSKDNIYWVDWGFKSVWKLSKNAPLNTEPEELIAFNNEVPFGIVANYQIADQTAGVSDCTILAGLSNNKTLINDAINIPKDVGLFCLHGVKTGISDCKCSPGFTGERCEISVCQNFCFYGDCSLNDKGQPECKCKHGYKGTRCETHVCSQYCLNEGMCSLGINEKLVCKCTNDFVGERCESRKIEPTMAPTIEACNCTRGENATKSIGTSANELYMDENCSSGWDPIRDPILMVLGTLCGLLCLVCAMLITKILYLKRRPRIKKRIIVNKNVTPLTARPDQCEITIENCCNMNICETPCFEPRNAIRPTLVDAKPGKEEKRNLIANMEQDDIY